MNTKSSPLVMVKVFCVNCVCKILFQTQQGYRSEETLFSELTDKSSWPSTAMDSVPAAD